MDTLPARMICVCSRCIKSSVITFGVKHEGRFVAEATRRNHLKRDEVDRIKRDEKVKAALDLIVCRKLY